MTKKYSVPKEVEMQIRNIVLRKLEPFVFELNDRKSHDRYSRAIVDELERLGNFNSLVVYVVAYKTYGITVRVQYTVVTPEFNAYPVTLKFDITPKIIQKHVDKK